MKMNISKVYLINITL